MGTNDPNSHLRNRDVPLDINANEFRKLGHQLVDQVAKFLDGLPQRPVTTDPAPKDIRSLIGAGGMPEHGTSPTDLLTQIPDLIFDNSLFNGHPRFWGYITSSAAPIGILADLLASAINPNVGAFILSPIATEIEAQPVRWIAELIGYPSTSGGLLVSGGNMANFVCFLTARNSKAPWDISTEGPANNDHPKLLAYVSKETHTWIDKAAELFGMGGNSVRRIETDSDQKMNIAALENQIIADRTEGFFPFMIVGAAGTVGTGAIDDLPAIAALCKKYDLWFHVDGAYGAPAAVLPDASVQLKGLSEADSIALDPHKWLYAPLEAGCALIRDPQHLVETFSHHPSYFNFASTEDVPPINFHEIGLQNSRGFRALKVWLGLRQAGKEGYIQMIADDIALAKALYQIAENSPDLEAGSHSLSITTFRYVPTDLPDDAVEVEAYLNELNEKILNQLQSGGEAFVSNVAIDGKYLLRACIVNFRTTLVDIEALPQIVIRLGKKLDSEIRPQTLH